METKSLIDEFYSKPYYLSYSGLNKLLYSPGLFFKHYVLQQKEDRLESYLIEGKVIHCLLLDDNSFNDHFMMLPSSLPGDSTRKAIDRIYAGYNPVKTLLTDYNTEILAYLLEINLHQALKDDKVEKDSKKLTGDQKRLDKIITAETMSYWEFLKIRGDKDLIDNETLHSCTEAVEAIRNDAKASQLLGLFKSEMENVDIFNEKFYKAETDKKFGIKGITDNVKVDYDNKVIYINDLKKTNKTISEFRETLEVFNYWAQAAIYYRLVYYNFADILTDEWKVVFHFVVVDKYLQVYAFEVSEATMAAWQCRLEDRLDEADWHYTMRDYTLPYEFANGKVIL